MNCFRRTSATTRSGKAAKTVRYRMKSFPRLPEMSTFKVISIEVLQLVSVQSCNESPLEVLCTRNGGGMKGAIPCKLILASLTLTKNFDSYGSDMYCRRSGVKSSISSPQAWVPMLSLYARRLDWRAGILTSVTIGRVAGRLTRSPMTNRHRRPTLVLIMDSELSLNSAMTQPEVVSTALSTIATN